jgi:hypothetical protein
VVDIETQGDKYVISFLAKRWYISPHSPDNHLHPIVIKIGEFGGVNEMIKRTNFGVNRLNGVGSGG